jgi:hypothetical protein
MKDFISLLLILLVTFIVFISSTKVGHFLFNMIIGGLVLKLLKAEVTMITYIVLAITALFFTAIDSSETWI